VTRRVSGLGQEPAAACLGDGLILEELHQLLQAKLAAAERMSKVRGRGGMNRFGGGLDIMLTCANQSSIYQYSIRSIIWQLFSS
jgi:hypothetical protein